MTKVLLVEDDPRIARFVKCGLEAEGYVVDVSGRGGEALVRCRDIDYPLIILDRMLPDTDGFEVCKRLKSDERTKVVPVVMLTALDREEQRKKGLDCGAIKYMTKPFDPDQLIETIRKNALSR